MTRPRSFSESELIDAAIELFWAKGYAAVSLADVTAKTGVTNGSLYQAYGTKWGVFLAAFRVYCARRVEVVEGAFSNSSPDVEQTLVAYFDAIVDDCLSHPDRRGCLMLNTISLYGTDPDVESISSATVAGMEHAVESALLGALPRVPREANRAAVAASAAQAVALSQALIQLSRIGRSPEELRTIGRTAASSTHRALLAS